MTDPGESNVLSAPRIGIQILNFNGARWLPELLRSLEHCRYPNKIVYLVDNGSTDGSVGEIRESPLDVRVIELGQDHGFAGAYNKSVPTAWEDGCEWVCLLNTDTLVCEGWLDAVATAGSHASSYGVMGPVHWSWESDRPSAFTKARFAGQLARFESEPLAWADADWIEGSCFFVRRGLLARPCGVGYPLPLLLGRRRFLPPGDPSGLERRPSGWQPCAALWRGIVEPGTRPGQAAQAALFLSVQAVGSQPSFLGATAWPGCVCSPRRSTASQRGRNEGLPSNSGRAMSCG